MRGIRLTHKVQVQLEQVPESFSELKSLIDRNFPRLKVETIRCVFNGQKGELIRSDQDLKVAYATCTQRENQYLDLALEGKEPMSFCCSKPAGQCCPKLPKVARKPMETQLKEGEENNKHGRMQCFKCAGSRFISCKLCGNTREIAANAQTKYKAILLTIQQSVESLVKKVVILREAKERERTEGLHSGIRCRLCGMSPIIGVRYQCSVCTDFNLCSKCEEEIQHQHFFIKIRGQKQKQEQKPNRSLTLTPPQNKGETSALELRLVKDVLLREGDKVSPGVEFTKIWRVRNDGKTQLPDGCALVYTNGDFGGEQKQIPMLMPGEECDLSVDCTAPELEGRYTSFWRAISPDGQRFGHRITIDIMVEHAVEAGSQEAEIEKFKELLRTRPGEMQAALSSYRGDVALAVQSLTEGHT